MRIAKRLILGIALPLWIAGLSLSLSPAPATAAEVLQCVPYARALSGIRIHGDAWTWWGQAKGHYQRGYAPRPGAVLSLANSSVMPLGHVAVVSRILDDRRILVRHANWSAPGLIEEDVLAIDASSANDWSQVRIWWGQGQQMGARLNPVNGFIYPNKVSGSPSDEDEDDVGGQEDYAPTNLLPEHFAEATPVRRGNPRLAVDPDLFRITFDTASQTGAEGRTLAMIVNDGKRGASLR